jgi:hypothetical protein
MAEDVHELFDDYAARFARGDRPDARPYLARAGEGADELAALIDRYLEAVPPPAPDEEARAAAAAWLSGEPPLLALRNRRGIKRAAVVDALVERLGLDAGKRQKIDRYYQRLETGLLDPGRVSSRVFDVLAETLRTSFSDLGGWRRARPMQTDAVFMRARLEDRAPAAAAPPIFDASEERDEIDVLFLEGGDGS